MYVPLVIESVALPRCRFGNEFEQVREAKGPKSRDPSVQGKRIVRTHGHTNRIGDDRGPEVKRIDGIRGSELAEVPHTANVSGNRIEGNAAAIRHRLLGIEILREIGHVIESRSQDLAGIWVRDASTCINPWYEINAVKTMFQQ